MKISGLHSLRLSTSATLVLGKNSFAGRNLFVRGDGLGAAQCGYSRITGVTSYKEKLEAYQRTTGLKDAVITGIGRIGEFRVALA